MAAGSMHRAAAAACARAVLLLLLLLLQLLCAPTTEGVSINRGGLPIQVSGPRPAQGGTRPGGQLHMIPAERLAISSENVQFHRAGSEEFGSQRAADGDNHTQAWIKAPREGAYIDVHWHAAADVARIVIVEHAVDFCKVRPKLPCPVPPCPSLSLPVHSPLVFFRR
eukprot:SAG22_NODE_803_length_7098_cov_2.856408_5_plen_167_part_00